MERQVLNVTPDGPIVEWLEDRVYGQTCSMCETRFDGRQYRQISADNRRFCSPRCKQKYYRLRKQLEKARERVAELEHLLG